MYCQSPLLVTLIKLALYLGTDQEVLLCIGFLNSYRQYLNYYLGWGNYSKKVYKTDKKAIILAKSVQKQSQIYKSQLKKCQKNLNNKYIIF